MSWGWRVPFLLSIVLVGIGLLIRMKILETPSFEKIKQTHSVARQPVIEVLRKYPKQVLQAAGARCAENGAFYIYGAIMTAVLAFPLFWLFDTGSTPLVILALLLVFLCSHAPMYAPQGAFFSELFGTSVRYSGASLGAQLSAAVAGGFSPLIATALLPKYGPNAIALYIILMAVITIIAVWSAIETMRHDIEKY